MGKLQHPAALPLHIITLLLSLLVPPFPGRRPLAIILIVATYLPTILRPISNHTPTNYGTASLWALTLRILTIHLFSNPNPETALYRPGQEKPGDACSYNLLQKARWLADLISANRGVGWNDQVRGLAARTDSSSFGSRLAYTKRALWRLLFLYIAIDAARTCVHSDPYLSGLYVKGDHEYDEGPRSRRVVRSAMDMVQNGITAWCFIEMQYLLASLAFVLVLRQAPKQWPPLFGSLKDAYRVQYVWGQVWHQLLRTTITPWGLAACRLLGFRNKRSRSAMLICVTVGFTLSALGHTAAVYVSSQDRCGSRSFTFFVMQGIGIVLENAFCWGWAAVHGIPSERERRWGKVLGYIWVFVWATWTNSLFADDIRALQLPMAEPLPWSPIRWLVGWQQKIEANP
ncbi:hypothetical protein BDZ91DRAFT_740203 [Kalaharituber pfeilii]|nr:hypothetical protein BDZ91DRAFT_740203 [Kalaharituber pfeilii]